MPSKEFIIRKAKEFIALAESGQMTEADQRRSTEFMLNHVKAYADEMGILVDEANANVRKSMGYIDDLKEELEATRNELQRYKSFVERNGFEDRLELYSTERR